MKNQTHNDNKKSDEKPSQTDNNDKGLTIEELEQVSGGLAAPGTKVSGGGQTEES